LFVLYLAHVLHRSNNQVYNHLTEDVSVNRKNTARAERNKNTSFEEVETST
jgi:hypothetical protein